MFQNHFPPGLADHFAGVVHHETHLASELKDEVGTDSDILLVVLLMAEIRLTTWDEEKPCK